MKLFVPDAPGRAHAVNASVAEIAKCLTSTAKDHLAGNGLVHTPTQLKKATTMRR